MIQDEAFPSTTLRGQSLLAIGCGDGQELTDTRFDSVGTITGVDIDGEFIERARERLPRHRFMQAPAELLPLPDKSFSRVMSRVTLPYTNLPRALEEIARVTKLGGKVFVSLHDARMQKGWFLIALRNRKWKRVLDHVYIVTASVVSSLTGWWFPRPWSGKYETFQTHWRVRREFERVGLRVWRLARTPKHLIVEATRTDFS